MQELLEQAQAEMKLLIEDMAFYQQQRIMTIFKETLEKVYKQGREDERYKHKGPTVNLYD